jgi:hypothetical protein
MLWYSMIDCRAYVGFFLLSFLMFTMLLIGLKRRPICVKSYCRIWVGLSQFFLWCSTLMCTCALPSIEKEVPLCYCIQFAWTSAHNDYYYFVGYVKEIRQLENLKLFVIIGDALVLCLKTFTTTNYLVLMMCLSYGFFFPKIFTRGCFIHITLKYTNRIDIGAYTYILWKSTRSTKIYIYIYMCVCVCVCVCV